MAVLVAGGAGYIGSHVCVELIENGIDVVILDNLSNSSIEVISRIEEITSTEVNFYKADILDDRALDGLFFNEQIDAVINFAGAKSVGESVKDPLFYYRNNVSGAITLLEAMARHGVKNLVFSSSATVYGDTEELPIAETAPVGGITNPYGRTKAMIEQILEDIHKSDPEWNIVMLRYFNPVGAHESGLIGEDPKGTPNNLMPYIAQVAIGQRPYLSVFGNDYPTKDGTGIRDYIHVVDLAKGHVKAMGMIRKKVGFKVYNLGTGKGYSVLELLHAFEDACGRELPYRFAPRREGDVAVSYCDPAKAFNEMGWKAEKTLDDMCRDSWRWQSMNPDGYDE